MTLLFFDRLGNSWPKLGLENLNGGYSKYYSTLSMVSKIWDYHTNIQMNYSTLESTPKNASKQFSHIDQLRSVSTLRCPCHFVWKCTRIVLEFVSFALGSALSVHPADSLSWYFYLFVYNEFPLGELCCLIVWLNFQNSTNFQLVVF